MGGITMGFIALIGFWCAVVRLWVVDGPKIPLGFVGLWFAGLFGLPCLGVSGFFFLAMEALLAVILLIIAQYKSAL
jgi:hypothetical protein